MEMTLVIWRQDGDKIKIENCMVYRFLIEARDLESLNLEFIEFDSRRSHFAKHSSIFQVEAMLFLFSRIKNQKSCSIQVRENKGF